jgi:hypothetical protein
MGWKRNCTIVYILVCASRCSCGGSGGYNSHCDRFILAISVLGQYLKKLWIWWQPSPIKLKKNSMVWVRERTIPTQRPPLVGEVRVPRGQSDGSRRPYSRFSRQEPLLFYQVAPQLYSRDWVGPVPDPLLLFVVPGNRSRDPCICSQELWPLDHRGGPTVTNNKENTKVIYNVCIMV